MSFTILPQFAKRGLALSCLAVITGCASVGPTYTAPEMKVPASWQAALPHEGSTHALLNWWEGFDDPVMVDLLKTAEADSPTLEQAAAAISSARATRTQASAKGSPSVNAGTSATRSGSLDGGNGPASSASLAGLDASWEIDLFGAVRRSKEAAGARIEARQADWHDARVSLAAEVANEYVNYRACRMLSENYRDNLESLNKTVKTTAVAAEQGFVAPADEALAKASAASAAATLNNQQTECELGVKALVALTGLEEPALREKLASSEQAIPQPEAIRVATLPVQLLSQRPDLVAAERSLAAASADIGVAEANRYPRLSLLGSLAANRTQAVGNSIQATPWSFGPSLALPLFNGGALRAQVAKAQAEYEAALGRYKGAVRNAVREAEQSLVRLDAAGRRGEDLETSARNYRRYYEAAQQNWRAGGISLLTLEEARRNALQAEQSAIAAQRDKVLYGIALYKALGGGWGANQGPNSTGVSQ